MRVWKEIIKKKTMREKMFNSDKELTYLLWDAAMYFKLSFLKTSSQRIFENERSWS